MTTVTGYQRAGNGDIYVVSGSADSTVKFWHVSGETGMVLLSHSHLCSRTLSVSCLHTIDFKNGFAITLELVPLDHHHDSMFLRFMVWCVFLSIFILVFLLFVGTDKNKLNVYQVTHDLVCEPLVISKESPRIDFHLSFKVELVFVLSGHEDWIRTIAIQKASKIRASDNSIKIDFIQSLRRSLAMVRCYLLARQLHSYLAIFLR